MGYPMFVILPTRSGIGCFANLARMSQNITRLIPLPERLETKGKCFCCVTSSPTNALPSFVTLGQFCPWQSIMVLLVTTAALMVATLFDDAMVVHSAFLMMTRMIQLSEPICF